MTPPLPIVLALACGDLPGTPVPGLLSLGGTTLLHRLLVTLGSSELSALPGPLIVVPAEHAEAALRAGAPASAIIPLEPLESSTAAQAEAMSLEARRAGVRAMRLAAIRTALAGRDAQTVLIHDAERALTPAATVRAVIDVLEADDDAVVPGVEMTDSVKSASARSTRRDGALDLSTTPDLPTTPGLANVERAGLFTLQAPRLLRRELLERVLSPAAAGIDGDEVERALALDARVRLVRGSHRGGAVRDQLSLWEAQIALGLARDTSRR